MILVQDQFNSLLGIGIAYMFLLLIPWLIGALFVGLVGKDRESGFLLPFIISIFFSPIIGFIFLAGSRTKAEIIQIDRLIELSNKQNDLLSLLALKNGVPDSRIISALNKDILDKEAAREWIESQKNKPNKL